MPTVTDLRTTGGRRPAQTSCYEMANDGSFTSVGPAILEVLQRPWAFKTLRVHGIEVTQGIQYYRAHEHLTQALDQGPDNSVRLVAGKTAWVRVYLRSGLPNTIPGVTGILNVYHRHHGAWWLAATLNANTPGNATANTNADYHVERMATSATLNFIVPAQMMCGPVRVEAVITATANGTTYTDTRDAKLDVTLHQTLKLAGIMVAYAGPDGTGTGTLTLPAPTLADLQATSAWMLKTHPLSAIDYRVAGTVVWGTPLTDPQFPPGGCSVNWDSLGATLFSAVIADGNKPNYIYYALMAAGIPMGPVGGCGWADVVAGPNGNQTTMAHEVGHGLGIAHSPCGNVGTSSPDYPAYKPYDAGGLPSASIGEYGLDVDTGGVRQPGISKDFMSYCNPAWISLYHHGRLIQHPMLHADRACVDDRFWDDWVDGPVLLLPWVPLLTDVVKPGPLITVIGVIDYDDAVSIHSVVRVATRPLTGGEWVGGLTAELLDDAGQVIAKGPVQAVTSQASGCGCSGHGDKGPRRRLFRATLPDTARGSVLRIVARNGDEKWSRRAPAVEPSVTIERAEIRDTTLSLGWRVTAARGVTVELWVRWSSDGEDWSGLMQGITGDRIDLDIAGLPAGDAFFQVLAHDGFSTAEASTGPLSVPEGVPTLAILHPQNGDKVPARRTIRLHGRVTVNGSEVLTPEDCRWQIDGEGVGSGTEAFVTAPAPGRHTCTLIVDRAAGTLEISTQFESLETADSAQP